MNDETLGFQIDTLDLEDFRNRQKQMHQANPMDRAIRANKLREYLIKFLGPDLYAALGSVAYTIIPGDTMAAYFVWCDVHFRLLEVDFDKLNVTCDDVNYAETVSSPPEWARAMKTLLHLYNDAH